MLRSLAVRGISSLFWSFSHNISYSYTRHVRNVLHVALNITKASMNRNSYQISNWKNDIQMIQAKGVQVFSVSAMHLRTDPKH